MTKMFQVFGLVLLVAGEREKKKRTTYLQQLVARRGYGGDPLHLFAFTRSRSSATRRSDIPSELHSVWPTQCNTGAFSLSM